MFDLSTRLTWPLLFTLSDAKDVVGIATGVFTIAAVAFAINKGLFEMRANREQRAADLTRREEELHWRKAEAAKKLNDEMLKDGGADCAMQMLDWSGRNFKLESGEDVFIERLERQQALRTDNLSFSDKEQFIRDCYDNLFYYLAIFEHHIAGELVLFDDMRFPVDYYIPLMAADKGTFEQFIVSYRQHKALAFLNRFAEWRDAPSVSWKNEVEDGT